MSMNAIAIERLVEIMARLRHPTEGCQWDVAQTFETIAPYTIEEAYEVADAIEREDISDLREELGDLLLQVVFHSRIAEEGGHFELSDVADAISDKMLARHPHVFAEDSVRTAAEQAVAWEEMKAAERAAKTQDKSPDSALDGVALALPALMRAEKLQKRAARVGFDWTEPEPIFDKLTEETLEVREAIAAGDQDAIEDEVGDLLFVAANLARRLNVDPEVALRRANRKFENRFRAMEIASSHAGQVFSDLNIEEQERWWQAIKTKEIG